MRRVLNFLLLIALSLFSRIFYRRDVGWIGEVTGDPWVHPRLVILLHHTSLFEWLFAGCVPPRFLWRIASHGVVPAADKTIQRPIVGRFFKLVARDVISITRKPDESWKAVLNKIDPDSMMIILPEGRMKRANGLDLEGKPLSVRGGVADIMRAYPEGEMLIAYSGGLHHIQVPGQKLPKLFKTIRLRIECLDIPTYRREMGFENDPDRFKSRVKADLDRRRDLNCPTDENLALWAERAIRGEPAPPRSANGASSGAR